MTNVYAVMAATVGDADATNDDTTTAYDLANWGPVALIARKEGETTADLIARCVAAILDSWENDEQIGGVYGECERDAVKWTAVGLPDVSVEFYYTDEAGTRQELGTGTLRTMEVS